MIKFRNKQDVCKSVLSLLIDTKGIYFCFSTMCISVYYIDFDEGLITTPHWNSLSTDSIQFWCLFSLDHLYELHKISGWWVTESGEKKKCFYQLVWCRESFRGLKSFCVSFIHKNWGLKLRLQSVLEEFRKDGGQGVGADSVGTGNWGLQSNILLKISSRRIHFRICCGFGSFYLGVENLIACTLLYMSIMWGKGKILLIEFFKLGWKLTKNRCNQ